MFSESVNRCQWSRNGLHFAAGGGEGVLSVYNFDPEAVKAELFASYSCGNDILALDWSYAAGAASSELLLYGMQGGGLGIFNMATSDILREMTVESASAVVDVAFAPSMISFAAATLNAPTPLSLWDLATGQGHCWTLRPWALCGSTVWSTCLRDRVCTADAPTDACVSSTFAPGRSPPKTV